ncbi:lactate dehydrogenase-like 2-hydroxyacid dehydrogenase [Hoeflea halophila]|uniref:Lactate dehydrogenase-like 2-hydroxyacid dehydrogenase n=1 Tax=Hoeflea halophila TaxID=714899 RepID=A0A286I8K4_9HYPH|nr:D-glycerate dehydrogenase [Hoeflea halophila]SOE16458.1 lactate dehydrogenase-like 2-hydroxyacid dehydrogenase [Hoeflea halophila]
MTRPKLWITRKLSDATLERAKRDYDTIINLDDSLSSDDEIVAMSAKVDAIIPCHSERFSADIVERLDPHLKIIANHSVGVDHCDLPALKARGIAVTNTPDVLSDATAEIAMLLMLGAARHAVEGDHLVRSGRWDFWSPSFMVGKQVTGARLGIVGMGRVGQAFARKARGFDMEIHYYNRSRLPADQEIGATYHSSVDSLLPVSDFLSLHGPATPETTGLMNAERFAQLPEGAVFVNTARGALVDEAALLEALSSGRLAAAGLDCFATEPGGNPTFAAHRNIFMLPHIGSATRRTRDAMGFRALDNLDAFFRGDQPRDLL